MAKNPWAQELAAAEEYFERSTRCLGEDQAQRAPQKGMYTVAQHVAHVAQTVDWFFTGAFREEGFDMDFAAHDDEVRAVVSLDAARRWLREAFARAQQKLKEVSLEEMVAPLPADGIMGGAPRSAIIGAIVDHTAHHRGALTVYSRLAGLTPAMPYMET